LKGVISIHICLVLYKKSAWGSEWTCTWTHKASTSANRDRDLAGYRPLSAGSTMLSNASMSCSWGVAHRTSDCSDLGLELQSKQSFMVTSRIIND
jgi:hypothetical protein